jgi:hypothetical protein
MGTIRRSSPCEPTGMSRWHREQARLPNRVWIGSHARRVGPDWPLCKRGSADNRWWCPGPIYRPRLLIGRRYEKRHEDGKQQQQRRCNDESWTTTTMATTLLILLILGGQSNVCVFVFVFVFVFMFVLCVFVSV